VGIIVSDSVGSSELDFVNVRLSVMDSDGERVVVVVSGNVSVGCNDAVEESE
jgi:glutamate 5-kinase